MKWFREACLFGLLATWGPAMGQVAPASGQANLSGMANSGRPGGISYVTRPGSTLPKVTAPRAFFAAGGIPFPTTPVSDPAANADRQVVAVAAAPATAPLDAQTLATLKMLAKRGDPVARQVLASQAAPAKASASR